MKNKVKLLILCTLLISAVSFTFGCENFDPDFFIKNRYTLTYDFADQLNILPSSISNYEIITPDAEIPTQSPPDDFHLIQSKAELEDFQNSFFTFDLDLEENYFDAGMLLIHPKATFGGPIKNLKVFAKNNKLIMKYNWVDGMADCYCYELIVVYLTPVEVL